MCGLSPTKPEAKIRKKDVDVSILMYSIVNQISPLNTAFKVSKDGVRPLQTTKQMKNAQANAMLCQKIKVVLKKDGMITIKNI